MSLIIHTVEAASSQVNFKYLDSHHLFGLEVVANYTFSITDLEYDDGATILTDNDAFEALRATYGKNHVVAKIGTDIFREGIITSISKENSTSKNNDTANVTIREFKRVEADGELAYLNTSIPSPQKVTSFSDNFTFSRSGGDISYTRNVSLEYGDDLSEEFLNNAYIFLKTIYLNNRPAFGYQTDGLSEKLRADAGFRPNITEEYDLINKSVSLTENLNTSFSHGPYAKKSTYTIRGTERGFVEKEYNIEVVGLREPRYHEALNGMKAEIDGLVDSQSSEFGNPIAITKTVSKDSHIQSATISFSTDPSQNQENTFLYTVTKTKDTQFYDYSVAITRKSNGSDRIAAYNNLKSAWASAQDDAKPKVVSLFPETSLSLIFEKSRNVTLDPYNASISETVVYTDNPDYNTSGDDLKKSVSVEINNPVERVFQFNVPLDRARLQRQWPNAKNTLGGKSINVQLIKKRGVDLGETEAEALSLAELPPEGTYWITEKTSAINPFEGTINAGISYNYFL